MDHWSKKEAKSECRAKPHELSSSTTGGKELPAWKLDQSTITYPVHSPNQVTFVAPASPISSPFVEHSLFVTIEPSDVLTGPIDGFNPNAWIPSVENVFLDMTNNPRPASWPLVSFEVNLGHSSIRKSSLSVISKPLAVGLLLVPVRAF